MLVALLLDSIGRGSDRLTLFDISFVIMATASIAGDARQMEEVAGVLGRGSGWFGAAVLSLRMDGVYLEGIVVRHSELTEQISKSVS